jgi:outer membrane protein OmpA-like peptidoglycan-associated protein
LFLPGIFPIFGIQKSGMKKFLLLFILALTTSLSQAQKKKYNPGDTIKENIEMYDVNGTLATIKIPAPTYLIFYRYSWRNIGWGLETADSVKLLEAKIAKILDDGEMHKVKLICISYDDKEYFDQWKKHVQTDPFKVNPRYTIEYYSTNGNAEKQKKCAELFSKVTAFKDDGRLMRWSSHISRFNFTLYSEGGFKGSTVKAKLLTENKGVKLPVENASVLLSTRFKNDTLSKAITDKYGDFQIYVPGNVKDYTIKVNPVEKVDNLLLVTQEGKEISNFEEASGHFEYRLLKADIVTLSEVKSDDIKMKYEAFHMSNEKELKTDEKIFYHSGKSDIMEESKVILNHIVKILTDNPGVTVEIISHTDAVGDDRSNLALSKKRAQAVADYLVKNGISAKRLKTDGEGEKKIRNRCFNGVDCSDREHEYNRRTEFKFMKP